jgi:hypothetical protein
LRRRQVGIHRGAIHKKSSELGIESLAHDSGGTVGGDHQIVRFGGYILKAGALQIADYRLDLRVRRRVGSQEIGGLEFRTIERAPGVLICCRYSTRAGLF